MQGRLLVMWVEYPNLSLIETLIPLEHDGIDENVDLNFLLLANVLLIQDKR